MFIYQIMTSKLAGCKVAPKYRHPADKTQWSWKGAYWAAEIYEQERLEKALIKPL